jgi:hypothetical protein
MSDPILFVIVVWLAIVGLPIALVTPFILALSFKPFKPQVPKDLPY